MADKKELLIGAEVPDAEASGPARLVDSRQERRAFRAFARRVFIFLAPIFFLVALVEALLWRAAETWPLPRVIRFQEAHPRSFFGRLIIDESLNRYKYLQILRRRPQILVLGSSRMMQFRAEMFGRQAPTFYNAGGMIHSIEDVCDFFDRLPQEATPRVVILGVDFWWLNANEKKPLARFDSFKVGVETEGTFSWQGHGNAIATYLRKPALLMDTARHTLGKNRDPNALGLQARLHRQGFRIDGSKRFDLKVPTTPQGWSERLPAENVVTRDILSGRYPFSATEGVSPTLREQLRAAVLKMKARGISVIGYNPPVISAWARVASTAPGQQEYWKQYHGQVPALFHSLNIPFFDIATPQQLGLDERYMRDAYHAYDTFDLHVLRYFCQDPQIQALFPDVANIAKEALASPRTNSLYLDLPGVEEQPREGATRRRKRASL
jgi:hypothetical protein